MRRVYPRNSRARGKPKQAIVAPNRSRRISTTSLELLGQIANEIKDLKGYPASWMLERIFNLSLRDVNDTYVSTEPQSIIRRRNDTCNRSKCVAVGPCKGFEPVSAQIGQSRLP